VAALQDRKNPAEITRMTADVSKQLDRAKRFLEKNRVEDAIETYQSILNESPGHAESLQALGDLYTRLGQADRAMNYYGLLFDRLCEFREDNKAAAIYSRALKGVQQPAERMARYAILLQKQNRSDEAIEQFSLASEMLLARGRQEPALDCLERAAQLDPDNAARQFAVGELATRVGKNAAAARAFLRAAQLTEASGDSESALELLSRAHSLSPGERSPALLYSQALLRRGDAATAAKLLEPWSASETDAAFVSTFGEALMRSGDLDRARDLLRRLPPEQPVTAAKRFELTRLYLDAKREGDAVASLREIQRSMIAAKCENSFATHLDELVESYPRSLPLAEFWAFAYADLNRESKYFDALARLFDMYLEAGNFPGACNALEKLVEIDPYDSRNLQRVERLQGHGDTGLIAQIRSRLSQVATHSAPAAAAPQPAAPSQTAEPSDGKQGLEDLMVQAEIFIQYSLQAKAVERLQKIAQLFPGEEERNERLLNLYQLANWWPAGASGDPARKKAADATSASATEAAEEAASTMRDLAKISEISQSLFRLPSARAILSATINEIGGYLRAARCLAVIGPPGKPPQMASEFTLPGMEPAPGGLLVRLLADFEHAAPDNLGGLPLDAAASTTLRELKLETALGVVLTDRDTQTPAGMVVAGYAAAHAWRPNETYFLQAVGDQMLLSVNHTRLRALARNLGTTDEKTGLLGRSSYQDCLLSETQRAKSQGTVVSLALLQIDHGPEVLRQQGEAQLDQYVEQLARAFGDVVRQTDLSIKYNSWTIAFILPDTALAGAQTLTEKLRKAGADVKTPWEGPPPALSASVAEAVTRATYESGDIVTELINRVESGLEEARHRGGDAVVTPRILGE
jgi:diguanylate cyclase (GGDEF)-like protein